jgi:DNA-binding SARP family transcriptional activator
MEDRTWIQVCGPLAVRIEGERRESALPGRHGRALVGYLASRRRRLVPRDELLGALWPDQAPDSAEDTLNTLLSRTRRALGAELIEGRSSLRLVLPADAFVDLEVAEQGIHEAESAIAQDRHAAAWAPARAALHAARRGFLTGLEAPWIDTGRAHVADIEVRALEAVAAVGLALGGAELAGAERAARALIEAAPYRETGYRALMEYFVARDEPAEALLVYDRLRSLLSDDLGVPPSAATQALHSRLLGAGA